LRGAHSGARLDGDAGESSEDDSSSDDEGPADESDGSGSALSELSDAAEDEEMDPSLDELNEYAAVDLTEDDSDEDADKWNPYATISTSSSRSRKFARPMPSLLKINPLNAVKRFIVDEMDAEGQSASFSWSVVDSIVEILRMRKSVIHNAHALQYDCTRVAIAHL
jgi:cobalamin biosynthesis protein CobT